MTITQVTLYTCFEKLTHPGPEETETAESKSRDPKGPTFVFCTCEPFLVRSNLLISCCLPNPTAYNKCGMPVNANLRTLYHIHNMQANMGNTFTMYQHNQTKLTILEHFDTYSSSFFSFSLLSLFPFFTFSTKIHLMTFFY